MNIEYWKSISLKRINSNFDTGKSRIPEIGNVEKNHAQATKIFLSAVAPLLNPNTILYTDTWNLYYFGEHWEHSGRWKKTLKAVEFLILLFFSFFPLLSQLCLLHLDLCLGENTTFAPTLPHIEQPWLYLKYRKNAKNSLVSHIYSS